ncbi:helix-turn-helix transcriptional regulator [Clostridiaceae bacterium Marseille-Q4143]|nr:helix-turn-helix transcriptional regulator [Clostridiaceae bacterium Marseille-Q4143]
MIDYSPLWQTMKDKNISQYYLLKHGIDNRVLDALKKNKNITLLTLEKICKVVECTADDVVKFVD